MIAWCGSDVFLGVVLETKNENNLRSSETRFFEIFEIFKRNINPMSHLTLNLDFVVQTCFECLFKLKVV